jgi:hypothetical protein
VFVRLLRHSNSCDILPLPWRTEQHLRSLFTWLKSLGFGYLTGKTDALGKPVEEAKSGPSPNPGSESNSR